MPTYRPHNSSRGQAIVKGRVDSIERYDKFYDIAWDALEKRQFPLTVTRPGQIFVRVADKNHSPTINSARTIPPAEFSSHSAHNRFSGVRLDGKAGQGALYTASTPGLLREMGHYRPGKSSGLILPGEEDKTRTFMDKQHAGYADGKSLFHVFRGSRPIFFADLRISSGTVQRFFQSVASASQLRRRYQLADRITGEALVQSILADSDISSARGLADAIFDHSKMHGNVIAGVAADSARSDSDWGLVYRSFGGGAAGTNYIFFGTPGTVVTAMDTVGTFASFKELADYIRK